MTPLMKFATLIARSCQEPACRVEQEYDAKIPIRPPRGPYVGLKVTLIIYIFSEWALWADSIYKLRCPCVCLCDCLCVCLYVCPLS